MIGNNWTRKKTTVKPVSIHRLGEWYKKKVFRDIITKSEDNHSEMGNEKC